MRKGVHRQAQYPELKSRNPHGRRKQLSPQSCSQTSTWAWEPWHALTPIEAQNKYKIENQQQRASLKTDGYQVGQKE